MSRKYIADGYFLVPLDELTEFLRKYATRHFHWYQGGDIIQFGKPVANEENNILIPFHIEGDKD